MGCECLRVVLRISELVDVYNICLIFIGLFVGSKNCFGFVEVFEIKI